MKIRKCSRTDEKDIRALWSYCFEREDDPWFRWYFRELYRPEDVLAGEEAGKIAFAKGISQGLSQGSRQKALETARLMKQANCEIPFIAKMTGLTTDEVEAMCNV